MRAATETATGMAEDGKDPIHGLEGRGWVVGAFAR